MICWSCGSRLEKAQMGWIEVATKQGILIGTLPDFDWDSVFGKDYKGPRTFGWIEEWRYPQLDGLYCKYGHIGMKMAGD